MNLYVYKRISTKEQLTGTGLEQQCDEATIDHVKQKFNLSNIIELESGIGLSGYHGKHLQEGEALRVFIDQCKGGVIPKGSILLIYSLDRISRMTGLTAITDVYAPIVQNGVRIYTKAESQIFDDSDMSQLMATLLFQRSHNESKTKADRVNNAILAGVNRYLTTGERTPKLTKSPFWIDNTTMTFNQWEESARYAVACRLNGDGYKVISSKLMELYPRKSERKDSKSLSFWEVNKIVKVFGNIDMLLGHKVVTFKRPTTEKDKPSTTIFEFGSKVVTITKEKVEGKYKDITRETYTLKTYYPTLITPQDALKLSNKPTGRAPSKPSNILRSLNKPVCGDCGYPIGFMEKTLNNFQYYCSGSLKGKSECKRNYVSTDFIDKWVLLSITAIAHLHTTTEDTTDNQLTTLKLEQEAIKNQLNELTEAYNKSKSPTLLGFIVDAENALQKVLEAIDKLESNITPTLPNVDYIIDLYKNFDKSRKVIKDMFESIIDTLVITKIPMETGYTWELLVTSGKYTIKQSVEFNDSILYQILIRNFQIMI